MKKIIALRKRYRALSLGRLQFLHPENHRILAYLTEYQDQKVLVVANLSDHSQHTELDLSAWQGLQLIELFGKSDFPTITTQPYHFTLGPFHFYWLLLASPTVTKKSQSLPVLEAQEDWTDIFQANQLSKLEAILPQYLSKQRWWNQKSHQMPTLKIVEIIPIKSSANEIFVLLIEIARGVELENYILPITFSSKKTTHGIIAKLSAKQGYLIDALCDVNLSKVWLDAIINNRKFKGQNGAIYGRCIQHRNLLNSKNASQPKVLTTEQSHSAIVFGKQWFLKCYRHSPMGVNPESEMSEYLNHTSFAQHVPRLIGNFRI